MAIYFKGGDKYKTLKGLLRGYYWTKRTPNTYFDPECTMLQFENNRPEYFPRYNRSFDIMLEMAQTYFPEVTAEELINAYNEVTLENGVLFGLDYTESFRLLYCPNIKKPVISSRCNFKSSNLKDQEFVDKTDFDARLRMLTDTPNLEKTDFMNDRTNCMYSMNELEEMLNK